MRADPVAVAVANVVKAAIAWRTTALRARAAGRLVSAEVSEAEGRVFAAVQAYEEARKAEKFVEEAPTTPLRGKKRS